MKPDRSRTLPDKGLLWSVLGAMCAFGMAGVGLASTAYAGSVTATASAVIKEPVSGVFSLSNFSIGAPVPTTEDSGVEEITASDTTTDTSDKNFGGVLGENSVVLPARFTVFGLSNQVFSIIIPDSVSTKATSGESVTLGNFRHTAGITPTMGDSGSTSFSVGAFAVKVNNRDNPASENNSAPIIREAGAPTDLIASTPEEVTSQTDDGDVTKRASDPFAYTPTEEGFLSVLISYN